MVLKKIFDEFKKNRLNLKLSEMVKLLYSSHNNLDEKREAIPYQDGLKRLERYKEENSENDESNKKAMVANSKKNDIRSGIMDHQLHAKLTRQNLNNKNWKTLSINEASYCNKLYFNITLQGTKTQQPFVFNFCGVNSFYQVQKFCRCGFDYLALANRKSTLATVPNINYVRGNIIKLCQLSY